MGRAGESRANRSSAPPPMRGRGIRSNYTACRTPHALGGFSMFAIPLDPAFAYALARWEDIRSIAASREVVAVWYEDNPATWIAFRVDAARMWQNWGGRYTSPEITDEPWSF